MTESSSSKRRAKKGRAKARVEPEVPVIHSEQFEPRRVGNQPVRPKHEQDEIPMVLCMAIRRVRGQGYQIAEFRAPAPTIEGLIEDDKDAIVNYPDILQVVLARWEDNLHKRLRSSGI